MSREEVTEYEVIDADGHREVRVSSSKRELYPPDQWARDNAGLGHQVRQRRIIVLSDWEELPHHTWQGGSHD
jgi:hypothetical protein